MVRGRDKSVRERTSRRAEHEDAPNPILSFDKCHEIFPMEIVAVKQGYESAAYSGVQLEPSL